MPDATKVYPVARVPEHATVLKGAWDEAGWAQAVPLVDFRFPWTAGACPATEFRAVCDGRRLCFGFSVADDDVVLVDDFRTKEDVTREDRVEVFFACDGELGRYFGLEIDPLGRTLDYEAAYYRQFNRSWTCPALEVVATPTAAGYTVKAAVPLAVLAELGLGRLDSPEGIRAGVFRAEFRRGPCGETIEDWISWVDPRTETPDFHVPTAFGRLRLA